MMVATETLPTSSRFKVQGSGLGIAVVKVEGLGDGRLGLVYGTLGVAQADAKSPKYNL